VELVTSHQCVLFSVRVPQQDKSNGIKNGRFIRCTFLQGGQENRLFDYGGISLLLVKYKQNLTIILLPRLIYVDEFIGIIGVDFDLANQLLVTHSVVVNCFNSW
jgi:hypothetical protein